MTVAEIRDLDQSKRKAGKRAARADENGDRLPPYNLQAEESCLGAMLHHHTAIDACTPIVAPADFYKPAHAHVCAAVYALHGRGEPVDLVTVAEELRRTDLLASIGGPGLLLALQASVPAIGAAGRYAAIVAEHAEMRSWIGAAAELMELGYQAPSDIGDARLRLRELLERTVRPAADGGTLEWTDMATIDVDADPPEAAWLRRSDGQALLYAGKVHAVHAEPSSGKSWLALVACAEGLNAGRHVVYLDLEDSPEEVARRLIALGVDPQAIRERFHYGQPWGAIGIPELAGLRRILDLEPAIVVIDGVAEALSREGLDEDSNSEFVAWMDILPRPCARAGAAVILIDHVAKDPEKRGRYARGAGGKLGAVDGATYSMTVDKPFDREHMGVARLTIAKDRHGGVGLIGAVAAIVTIDPSARGRVVRVRLDPDLGQVAPGDSWKPTRLMEKASRELEGAAGPVSATTLKALIGSREHATEAIHRLTQEGFIAKVRGGFRSLKPYRADAPPTAPVGTTVATARTADDLTDDVLFADHQIPGDHP